MSETVSSASDSGQGTTNETEDYQDDVSEVYPLEIFETVKKGLRAERRVILNTNETKQCLHAVLSFIEAERLTQEEYRLSREFLSQVFPCIWKHVVRGDHTWESLLAECVTWGKILARMAITLLEKIAQTDFTAYNELARRTFNCLELFFQPGTLAFQQDNAHPTSVDDLNEEVEGPWPRSLAMDIIDQTMNLVCRMVERFFTHQIFEEYSGHLSEELLETALALYAQMTSSGIDKEALRGLSDLLKTCIKDIRPSPVDNFTLSFVSSPNMIEYIYRLVYYTDSVQSAEETVGEFRRHLMKEQLNHVSFTSRLNAVRSLTSYLDSASMFEDPNPIQHLQKWMNQEDIVGMMLGSNVEKVHYAEHVLSVLERMAKVNIFETDHIDILWSLVETDGVFEGLRDNVIHMTGVLAKQLSSEHKKYIIKRVEEGLGGDGYISKSLIVLLSSLQGEDTEVLYVESLLRLFWSVLLAVGKLDDTGKTFSFQECIRGYYDRGFKDLPEKYLMRVIEILENGQVTVTMLQVFVEMYHLFVDSYPNKKPSIDPHALLVKSLDRYHMMLAKMKSNSEVLDMYYLCRIINQFLMTLTVFSQSFSLDLAKRIWDICVLNSLCEAERIDVLSWFQRMIDREPLFMTISTLSDLLDERICHESAADIDYVTFSCFKTCFCKVVSHSNLSIDCHPAMDYLWKIFLETRHKDVVQDSRILLICLYLDFDKEEDFLRRLMEALTDSLKALAGLQGSHSCSEVIEKLTLDQTPVQGKHGTYITRCIEALDVSLQPSALDKQHPSGTKLKSMLSQSESMNQILVFLADSCSSKHLRDGVCEVLDTLPVYQPLLQKLDDLMCQEPAIHLTIIMNDLLFPGKNRRYTAERTRYALRVLHGALCDLDPRKDDFEEIGCSCLLYILEAISQVALSELSPAERANCHQRLHGIGVEIVGQLMWKLKMKSSSTNSEHSSPEAEEPKDCDYIMASSKIEGHQLTAMSTLDGLVPSESDQMDISHTKSDGMDQATMQFTAATGLVYGERQDQDHGQEITSKHLAQKKTVAEKSPCVHSPHGGSSEEASRQGCTSVDSVNGQMTDSQVKDEMVVQQKSPQLKASLAMEKAIEYLIKVAHEGSSGWTESSTPTDIDVQLVELSVNQLIGMIEQWTMALDCVLAYSGVIDIIMNSLLNPVSKIRQAFLQLATRICHKSESASSAFYSSARKNRLKADLLSMQCVEFYQLLEHFVHYYFQQVHMPPAFVEDAQQMLQELIQCVREAPSETEPDGLRLCKQLALINVLITVLKPEGITGILEGDLVLFLIQEILFPEAVLLKTFQVKHQLIASEDVKEIMKTKINPVCARQAAFELLLKLIKSSTVNLEVSLSCLNQLHFGLDAATREVAGSNAGRAAGGYVGLQNGGATCYMNSIIQQLFMQPAVRDTILSVQNTGQIQDQSRCVFKALQKVFGYLAVSNRRFYYPREFLENFTHSDGTRVDVRQHHDALEFFQRTQELVDEFLVRHGSKPIIKNVVGTTHVQQIICEDNGETYISESEQTYTSCSLDIVGKNTLHDSLEAYVQGELLEGSDAYHCEALNKKVSAMKRLCLKSPPLTLVLQLKRFEMDYQLMETYKINDRFEFPLELNIFPYTASGLMQKEGITKHNGADGEASPKLHPSQCLYTLKGIVVHTGEIDGGHYYSFIKERSSPSQPYGECKWWRFDDSFVEMWDISRLDEDCFGGTTELDMHDTQRVTKMNNAYILIYEHCSSKQEVETNVDLPSPSEKGPLSDGPKTVVPPFIEQEVLNDNLALLSGERLAEKCYMRFILKLLRSMLRKDDLNRRKMRRVTPCSSSRGGSNCDSSTGSGTSPEKSPDEAYSNRGERTGNSISTVKSIATVACEYIFKVILTPYVFQHADGLEWADAIQIIVENSISCEIALEKLAEHADHSFRCLVYQGNEASKEFLSQFLSRVIQTVDNQNMGNDGSESPVSKFLIIILDHLDHRWSMNFDVSRVLDIACLIAEILYRKREYNLWLNLFEALMLKSIRYAKIVYFQGRGQFMRSLDIINRSIVRLFNSCAERNVRKDEVEDNYDDDDDDGDDREKENPKKCIDPSVIRVIEKMTSQRHLVKSLLRPTMLSDPGTIHILKILSWENEPGSITMLESMQEYLPDMENCDGELFVSTVNAFLDLVCVHDKFYPMKLTYLLFGGNTELNPWKLICGNIQHLLRWRLLYFLMVACEREERQKKDLPPPREWEKVLDWMRRDTSVLLTTPGEAWLDKHQIYQWASQFEGI